MFGNWSEQQGSVINDPLEENTMDLSYRAMLATRFATIALVFSVSACVLSKSISDDEHLSGKAEPKATSSDEKQQVVTQKPAPTEKPGKAAQVDKANAKNTGSVKSTSANKPANTAQQTPGKPGTIRATNQKVSKLAVAGKLDKQQPAKKEIARQPVVEKKVIRYVNVETLNVRMNSSEDAPVVGKLTKGTMYHVSIEGNWAKISDSQYVMSKYLSNQPPKKTGNTWTYRK